MHTIRTLTPQELPKYRDHLLRLGPEDRRLRFGAPLSDHGVIDYCRRINPVENRILVHIGPDMEVVGAVQIAAKTWDVVEFAFSVEEPFRNRGVGTTLMDRALLWARNRGIRHAYVYCLMENHSMRRLARKAGMALRTESGDCEGHIDILNATPLTVLREFAAESIGFPDLSLKANRKVWGTYRLSPAA